MTNNRICVCVVLILEINFPDVYHGTTIQHLKHFHSILNFQKLVSFHFGIIKD